MIRQAFVGLLSMVLVVAAKPFLAENSNCTRERCVLNPIHPAESLQSRRDCRPQLSHCEYRQCPSIRTARVGSKMPDSTTLRGVV